MIHVASRSGEQFQASLALGLALEIARAGSRIECLLLDEGFAELDPARLDTALGALESAARRTCRIVAITQVHLVTGGPSPRGHRPRSWVHTPGLPERLQRL